jgi:hypothetical protein
VIDLGFRILDFRLGGNAEKIEGEMLGRRKKTEGGRLGRWEGEGTGTDSRGQKMEGGKKTEGGKVN